MKLIASFFVALSLGVVFLSVAHAQSPVFYRNLTLGDRGADVRELQKVLNREASTRVALSGPGSLGNETDYFGPATRAALALFQTQHAQEILAPYGLSVGTGFFGPATRTYIEQYRGSTQAQSTQEATNIEELLASLSSTPAPTYIPVSDVQSSVNQFSLFTEADNDTVRLAFISSHSGVYGDRITLTGTAFDPLNNTVYIGEHRIEHVPATDSNHLTFTLPESIPTGVYMVEVGNAKGKSESDTFFVLTEAGAHAPVITSLSPSPVSIGQMVTVTGQYFTPTNNTIRTTLGTIDHLSSPNGTTLTFRLESPPTIEDFDQVFDGEFSFPLAVTVVNAQGVSKYTPASIIIVH